MSAFDEPAPEIERPPASSPPSSTADMQKQAPSDSGGFGIISRILNPRHFQKVREERLAGGIKMPPPSALPSTSIAQESDLTLHATGTSETSDTVPSTGRDVTAAQMGDGPSYESPPVSATAPSAAATARPAAQAPPEAYAPRTTFRAPPPAEAPPAAEIAPEPATRISSSSRATSTAAPVTAALPTTAASDSAGELGAAEGSPTAAPSAALSSSTAGRTYAKKRSLLDRIINPPHMEYARAVRLGEVPVKRSEGSASLATTSSLMDRIVNTQHMEAARRRRLGLAPPASRSAPLSGPPQTMLERIVNTQHMQSATARRLGADPSARARTTPISTGPRPSLLERVVNTQHMTSATSTRLAGASKSIAATSAPIGDAAGAPTADVSAGDANSFTPPSGPTHLHTPSKPLFNASAVRSSSKLPRAQAAVAMDDDAAPLSPPRQIEVNRAPPPYASEVRSSRDELASVPVASSMGGDARSSHVPESTESDIFNIPMPTANMSDQQNEL